MRYSFFLLLSAAPLVFSACNGDKELAADDAVQVSVEVKTVPEGGSVLAGLAMAESGGTPRLMTGSVTAAATIALNTDDVDGLSGPVQVTVVSLGADGAAVGDTRTWSASSDITGDDGDLLVRVECEDDGTTLSCKNCRAEGETCVSAGGGSGGGSGSSSSSGGSETADTGGGTETGLVVITPTE